MWTSMSSAAAKASTVLNEANLATKVSDPSISISGPSGDLGSLLYLLLIRILTLVLTLVILMIWLTLCLLILLYRILCVSEFFYCA